MPADLQWADAVQGNGQRAIWAGLQLPIEDAVTPDCYYRHININDWQ